MSSASNSPSTGLTNEMGSKVKSVATSGMLGVVVFTLTAIGLFIGAFTSMSKFVGSKDDWNLIQPQIWKILILTIVGTVSLMIASLLYFIQDPARMNYFILLVGCLSLGLSFAALATAAISR